MNIGFILGDYFAFRGLQRDCLKIAEVCADRGHTVTFFARTWQGERSEKIQLILLGRQGITNVACNRIFFKKLQTILPRYQLDGLVGFNRLLGLDVYFAGDPCYEEKVSRLKPSWYRWTQRYRHFKNLETSLFARGNKTQILMLTDHEIPLYQRHYQTESERFHLLPPGIEPLSLSEAQRSAIRQRVRAEHDYAHDAIVLLFVGSDFPLKGLDRVLHAMAALPEVERKRVRLAVIGRHPARPFVRWAQKHQLSHLVRFLGGCEHVRDFFLAADLLVHPARSETAGLVLLEALVAGLPVFTTAVCGYAFHIQNAQAGIVTPEPFNQATLDQQLRQTLADPDTRTLWRRNALQYAEQTDLYSCHQKAATIIEEVILKKLG